MAQTQGAGDPEDPDATGGMPDSPELWGNNGLVGDGRYRLTRRLGRGGMAEVFAAEDLRLGRTVAVKLLRSDLAEDPVSKARFTREAQSVAGLNHHAVVAVYDSGEEMIGGNVTPYIVMELVEGRTIRDLLLSAEAPPPDQALIIVSGVLEALSYSHQHGIVHRDIKPANVIITSAGAVKVMDFGIARALHGASNTMTQTGMVMGTPQYLSPEQALGKTVDTRSDLYATGCLLYELLTVRPPFVGETPLSVVYQHVQDDPVPPSQLSQAVPPELDGLVMRSLAKDPDDRFQTAEEMRGLAQYGLQMLHEQGGHTGGLWDTGALPQGGSTPPMGVPSGAGAQQHPAHGDTSQLGPPLLMGRPDRDDGGFEGGSRGGRGDGRGGRGGKGGKGGKGKWFLIALLALLAIAAGVAFALSNGDGDGGDGDKVTPETSTSSTKDESSSEDEPDGTPTPTEDDEFTETDGPPGDGTDETPDPTTPTDESPSETDTSPTDDPPPDDTPTETESSDDGSIGGGDGGPGGPTETEEPPPTDGETDGGGDAGAGGNGGGDGPDAGTTG